MRLFGIGSIDYLTGHRSRRRRGPFLSPGEIVAYAIMVGALLLILFPGRDFAEQRSLLRPDGTSVAYLGTSVRAYPDRTGPRLQLVQHLMALGRLAEARETLGLLPNLGGDVGQRAKLLALKLDRTRLFALLPGDPGREALQDDVRRLAVQLIPVTTQVEDLGELADLALAFDRPGLAVSAFERLVSLDRPHAVGWLEKAGHWSIAAADPAGAARFYGQAALGHADPSQGVRLAREALAALLAANQGKKGLSLAQSLVERFGKDLALLDQAVAMALAVGDLGHARQWGEQRVALAGGSDAALRQQMSILKQAGDVPGALKLGSRLLQRSPWDQVLRREVAQMAHWSSHPEEAMHHFSVLAHEGNIEDCQKALELADALNDENIRADMLELKAKRAIRRGPPQAPQLTPAPSASPERSPRNLPLRLRSERRRPQV
jgi:hypothetical protein